MLCMKFQKDYSTEKSAMVKHISDELPYILFLWPQAPIQYEDIILPLREILLWKYNKHKIVLSPHWHFLFCWDGIFIIPPPNEVGGGVYWIHLVRPSVRLSVCPSVCRRHGFRSISQVCFGISISNFICMLMVAIGRSLLIFSDVTFKMAAWRPYWIFWFPDSNFTLALNINFKLQRHNTYVYG